MLRYVMGPVEEVSGYIRTMEPVRVERDPAGGELGRVRNEVEDVFLAQLRFAGGAIGSTFSNRAQTARARAFKVSPVESDTRWTWK